MKYTIGTKTHCEAVQAAADKLLGYPRTAKAPKPKPATKKLQADAYLLTGQEEFEPRKGPDVTMATYAEVRRHPKREEYAYPITADIEKASTASLGAGDKQAIDDAKASAVTLSEDWESDAESLGAKKAAKLVLQ